jgi:C_GCAxxG_C_C family probable redox protein
MTTHERQEYAAQLKREMNCCQAVVRAFADTLDIPEDKLMQLAAGFGSGMGNMEGTCGALVGAGMAAGFKLKENSTTRYTRQISENFRERCGAVLCKDLKGRDTGNPLCSCEDCVRNAILAYGKVVGLD